MELKSKLEELKNIIIKKGFPCEYVDVINETIQKLEFGVVIAPSQADFIPLETDTGTPKNIIINGGNFFIDCDKKDKELMLETILKASEQ